LLLGATDTGTGGAGADTFRLLADTPSGAVATVTDFDPAEDMIAILSTAANPVTVVSQTENEAGVALGLSSGVTLQVNGVSEVSDDQIVFVES